MDNRRLHSNFPTLLRRLSNLIGIETSPLSPNRRFLDCRDQSEVQLELDLGIDLFGRGRRHAGDDAKTKLVAER